MAVSEDTGVRSDSTGRRSDSAVGRLLWTAASFPVAVLSHEIAHFAVYRYFGFPEPKLHFGSASFAVGDEFWRRMDAGDIVGATQLVPPWQAGVAA
ncbi:MAG: hypothetical protein FD129_2146, partial [bacterium]